MVDFQTYMSVGLNKCGSDRRTFGQLVQLWNREEAAIREMSRFELGKELSCP